MDAVDQLRVWFSTQLPNVVQALVILLVGWIVAMILSTVVRNVLTRVRADERLNRQVEPQQFNLTDLIAKAVFWLTMLFAIVGALNSLEIGGVAEPFSNFLNQTILFLPRLLGAAVLAVIAWIVATVVKRLIEGALNSSNWGERLRRSAGMEQQVPLGSSLGTLAYWLVWLLFLPGILDALGIQGLLAPVQGMVNDLLAFLPNLASAAIILLVGYFVARIVRDIVTNLLASTGLDNAAARVGFGEPSPAVPAEPLARDAAVSAGRPLTEVDAPRPSMTLSRLIGLVVFALILIPVAITALDALNLEALSQPAISMLNQVLDAIPNIFAAVILLAIAYFVARLIADLVTNLLAGVGFDRVLDRIGLTSSTPGGRRPSEIAGTLLLVAIMLFAATEAANLLGFEALSTMVTAFLAFFGNVLLGLVVLALGLYLANMAGDIIRSSGMRNRDLMATIARGAIIALAIFMALQQMGIAVGIVTLAFGLILGSVAVAAAIAMGLGGRDLAKRELERAASNLRDRPQVLTNDDPPAPMGGDLVSGD